MKHLLNVTFKESDGSTFSFDENGDTAGKYVIRNMQLHHGEYSLVDIGIWDPYDPDTKLKLEKQTIQWLPDIDPPKSVCVDDCGLGYISVPLKQKCCLGCQKCPRHAFVANGSECVECPRTEWPDQQFTSCQKLQPSSLQLNHPVTFLILFFSLLGIILCIFTVLGIWHYRHHQLVKATSRELSTVNLVGLTLGFISSCCLAIHPTSAVCLSIEILITLCFTLSFAPILLKVARIWRIFDAARKSVRSPRFVGPRPQLILTGAAVFLQVCIFFNQRYLDRVLNMWMWGVGPPHERCALCSDTKSTIIMWKEDQNVMSLVPPGLPISTKQSKANKKHWLFNM